MSIDVSFRPVSYFGPQRLEDHLIAQVQNAVLRRRLQSLADAGRYDEIRDLLSGDGISSEDAKALGAIHPMFMGGNYLPETTGGEVEIARICIASTTFDVTCLYASRRDGSIHYRVVDEYDGDTLSDEREMDSNGTLTLGEMIDFFLGAWPLINVLEMNFDDDLDGSLDFFNAESDFYPEFDHLCRQRVIEHFSNRNR